MPRVKIDRDRCKGCQLCIVNCSKGLIKIDKKINSKGIRPMVYVNGQCSGCGFCAIICPDSAVEIYK